MTATITLGTATVEDGEPIWRLVGELQGLEQNTCYAYLLLCSHFGDGCVVARRGANIVGFVLGYRPPSRPDAMFVWQVGVHPEARGQGLGTRLLDHFTHLPAYRDCTFLEATVGTSNTASQALFRGFASKREVPCEEGPGFPAALFGDGGHEDEDLFRIGPLGD